MDNKFLKGLIREMNIFMNGKNPEELRVFKTRKDGKPIEIINELELIKYPKKEKKNGLS